MSAQTPKFLMGGVKFANNFFGWGTVKAAVNTGVETGIKTAPLIVFFYGMGRVNNQPKKMTFIDEKAE